jgi:hypothetical protein
VGIDRNEEIEFEELLIKYSVEPVRTSISWSYGLYNIFQLLGLPKAELMEIDLTILLEVEFTTETLTFCDPVLRT